MIQLATARSLVAASMLAAAATGFAGCGGPTAPTLFNADTLSGILYRLTDIRGEPVPGPHWSIYIGDPLSGPFYMAEVWIDAGELLLAENGAGLLAVRFEIRTDSSIVREDRVNTQRYESDSSGTLFL